MNITIRNATTSDVKALSELFVEFMGGESDIEKMKLVIEKLDANPQYYISVADNENSVIGVAMGIICEDICGTCEPFMLIEDVVVLPKYRRSGVGKTIMDSLEQFGKQNHCKYAILVSEPKRTDSHVFYEKLGYHHEMGFKKRFD